MNNADVEAILLEIAELLELKKESTFRVRAYENAARAFDTLSEDVNVLVREGRLKKVKGIGDGIATKVQELLETGSMQYLEDLRRAYPPGVRSLMAVPGVGPAIARRAYEELGIDSIEGLKQASEDGRLASLPGLGTKSAENVVRALSRVKKRESRVSIGKALPLAEQIIAALRPLPSIQHLVPGGSLRRWSPTIGDVDIIATSSDASPVMEAFVGLPIVHQVLAQGPTKSSIIADNGVQVDLRILEAEAFGSLLQHFTGSKAHNIELREYALKRGQSLSEYGITSTTSKQLTKFSEEDGFYAALDLAWIPPELREGSGEIVAAAENRLPELVTLEDIRGDLHVHTDWSDGALPLQQMVASCQERGYEYVAITDHSPAVGFVNGLTPERVDEQLQLIAKVQGEMPGIRIFSGIEVDIKRDGSLDLPDETLAKLDWVIASVHSAFNQSEDEMTKRVLRAVENPHVDALGHPTGVLIGHREPYALNLEAVFQAAARSRTCIEINASPERLDLVDHQARRARELGVMLTINTDAHAPVHLTNMRYGVAMARRAWTSRDDVINTLAVPELERRFKNDGP